ncbi:MAG: helix-hairpin-helix domain-containing protein [Myxococcaceae bacterium]|nr:helix-hairpin-helix domain-containing protein [Myxococcaceae bacterium]
MGALLTSARSSAAVRLALALLCCAAPRALAEDYGADIRIDTEDDLYDLHQQGVIDDDQLETLVDLLDTGVDLNTADADELYALPTLTRAQVDAILQYRKLDGYIEDPKALVEAGAITQEQLAQIAPFLVISERAARIPVSGKVSLRSRYALSDPVSPPLMLKSRLKLPFDLSAGVALTTTRYRLGSVRYDPIGDALMAQPARYGVYLPKLFVQWKSTGRTILAGTFRLGFAERLTLDNARRTQPNGIYGDDIVYNRSDLVTFCRYSGGACEELEELRATPDYAWPDSFRGVAASIQDLSFGTARLDLTGFGSFQSRSIYQYQVFDRSRCEDPHDDSDTCSAPPVYEAPDGVRRFNYVTLPDVMNELTGGGNVTIKVDERTRAGLTGYYALPIWNVPGIALDFQDYASWPYGGAFGAIGINGATKVGPINFYAEAARSFDHEPGNAGGGYAVEQRTVYSQKKQELELSLRYYDRHFLNPYAHAPSGSDELDGQRVRNELGARIRYLQAFSEDWRVRATLNTWTLPYDGKVQDSAGTLNTEASVRADFKGWRFFQAAAWAKLAYKQINPCTDEIDPLLVLSGEDPEIGASGELGSSTDLAGDYCDPKYVRTSARAQLAPFGDLVTFAVQPSYKTLLSGARRDASVWFEVAVRPVPGFKIRAKTRYEDFDLSNDENTERTSWTWVDLTWSPGRQLLGRLRYDALVYVDHRESTQTRRPNPEHRLQVLLESKF